MYSNLKWKGGYIMSDDAMQTMMSLMLAEMREMRSNIGELKQGQQRIEKKLDLHDAQFAALIKGQTALANSVAEVKDNLSAKIAETQKDNEISKEILKDMLYDIALLKTKVK